MTGKYSCKTLEEIEKSIDRCRMVNEREGIEFLSPRISADTLAALVGSIREMEKFIAKKTRECERCGHRPHRDTLARLEAVENHCLLALGAANGDIEDPEAGAVGEFALEIVSMIQNTIAATEADIPAKEGSDEPM